MWLLVTGVIAGGYGLWQWLTRKSELDRLPRPESTLPALGNTLDAFHHQDDFHDWIYTQCQAFEGRPWLLEIIGRPLMVVVSDPLAFEDVLKTQFWCFEKGVTMYETLLELMGHGIFSVDGEQWLMQRKTASQLFTMRQLRDAMTTIIHSHVEKLVEVLKERAATQQPVDLFKLLTRFTTGAFCELGFGVDFHMLNEPDDNPFQVAFDRIQHALQRRFLRPIWFWKLQRLLSVGVEAQVAKDAAILNETAYKIIRSAMQSKPDASKRDLIALFLQHVDSNVNPQFLRDVVMGFLIAGRDTMAQTLSWCLYCINDRPDIYQRLQDELQDQLQGVTAPSVGQVQSLVFMEAVLKETLRLYPPVPFNWKTAIKDTTLSDGTRIPKGTSVAFPSYALGRMTTVWGPDALVFKPGRWLNEKSGKLRQVSPFQFPAFHAGPRICLGRNLALLEMKLVLVSLLSHGLKIYLEPGQPVTYGSGITLPLKPGLLGRVRATI